MVKQESSQSIDDEKTAYYFAYGKCACVDMSEMESQDLGSHELLNNSSLKMGYRLCLQAQNKYLGGKTTNEKGG
ncbi:hypothetical protein SLEP1_g9820 [Rubroshorea leprosula]|uniref:Uncharacterized protein n=1 Tax=Rubroshorea leprosula TaxID=152421 RepID=A0AAV5I642_9ROSI|nr:hypothetical protein SLEP1_g9820 [Rubroshorea leprosula]